MGCNQLGELMKNKPITSNNKEWGFWGTSERNGYDVELTWNETSKFLSHHFGLTPEQARDVLDARFGRHLADELSFIKGGITKQSISKHLKKLVADKGWNDCFRNAIKDATGIVCKSTLPTKAEIFTQIAQDHLGIETLAERKSDSLDFHSVGVLNIQAALEAAYQAGLANAKN